MKFNKAEKKQILIRYIEIMVMCGHDISNVVGVSMTKFNFEALIENTVIICKEYDLELTETEESFMKNKYS